MNSFTANAKSQLTLSQKYIVSRLEQIEASASADANYCSILANSGTGKTRACVKYCLESASAQPSAQPSEPSEPSATLVITTIKNLKVWEKEITLLNVNHAFSSHLDNLSEILFKKPIIVLTTVGRLPYFVSKNSEVKWKRVIYDTDVVKENPDLKAEIFITILTKNFLRVNYIYNYSPSSNIINSTSGDLHLDLNLHAYETKCNYINNSVKEFSEEILEKTKDLETESCPVCLNDYSDPETKLIPVISNCCNNIFCENCIKLHINSTTNNKNMFKCIMCRSIINCDVNMKRINETESENSTIEEIFLGLIEKVRYEKKNTIVYAESSNFKQLPNTIKNPSIIYKIDNKSLSKALHTDCLKDIEDIIMVCYEKECDKLVSNIANNIYNISRKAPPTLTFHMIFIDQ